LTPSAGRRGAARQAQNPSQESEPCEGQGDEGRTSRKGEETQSMPIVTVFGGNAIETGGAGYQEAYELGRLLGKPGSPLPRAAITAR